MQNKNLLVSFQKENVQTKKTAYSKKKKISIIVG